MTRIGELMRERERERELVPGNTVSTFMDAAVMF